MKFFCILLATLCAATSFGQTIKSLGFNTTNGQVVANTGTNVLNFTNKVSFAGGAIVNAEGIFYVTPTNGGLNLEEGLITDDSNNTVLSWSGGDETILSVGRALSFATNNAAATRTNLGLGWTGLTNTNASGFRSALELSAGWLTNTNVTNFRSAIGLGATNQVTFEAIVGVSGSINVVNGEFMGAWYFDDSVSFGAPNVVRANLGLPLAALTNTSNVTAMRALSGSTNTNHPFSGSVSVVGTNNTNTLVFSNGILQSVQ
jgi:hypothetical protein